MREILFRGKQKNGTWLYGDLTGINYHTTNGGWCYINGIGVGKKTVGQYTGLQDKNGERIFEGDIVGVGECDKIYEKVVVYFDKGAFRVSQFAIDLLETRNIDCEVIGNIYDNPELLEG